MAYQFKKHYTRDEARGMLPQLRQWLQRLTETRAQLSELDQHLTAMVSGGNDSGGEAVNQWVRTIADMKETVLEFQNREIQIKDPDRGLIDFPAIIQGREAFFCWEKDEDDIEFWHDLDTGYAERERL